MSDPLREALEAMVAAHDGRSSSAKIKHAAFLKAKAALSAQVPEDDAGLLEAGARALARLHHSANRSLPPMSGEVAGLVETTWRQWETDARAVLEAADRIEALSRS